MDSIALTVAYNGRPFAGCARQPGIDTVQGRIEHALSVILRQEVETTLAGRTDAGVHALGQVVSFEYDGTMDDLRALRRSIDALTGDQIIIRDVRRAREGFSARFDAVMREYRYRIVDGSVAPLFLADFAWHVNKLLDVEQMREAARAFVGEQDFKSFCVALSAEGKRTVRRVDAVEVSEAEHLGERCIEVRVVGNAFLHSMVRVMVGTLVEVGLGRRDVSWVREALDAKSREAAGPTAPAHGLTLWHVTYPDEVWR